MLKLSLIFTSLMLHFINYNKHFKIKDTQFVWEYGCKTFYFVVYYILWIYVVEYCQNWNKWITRVMNKYTI